MRKTMLLSLALISALNAQETRLDESVISATGFEESIGESNKNVTVITKEEIENSGKTDVLDFLKTAPFVTIANDDRIDMRGQGRYANRSIQVLIDGISINSLDDSHRSTPLDVLDMNDIERIEIIPGGGAVLFGSGTRGGVINIITTKSSMKNRASVGIMGGSYNLLKGRVNLGYSITDNLYLMGNFQKYEKDGYRDGTNEKAYYANGAIKYKFLDNHSLTLGGNYSEIEEKTAYFSLTQEELDADRKQSPSREYYGALRQFSQSTQRDKKFDLKYQYSSNSIFAEALGYYQDISMDTFDDTRKGGKLKAKYSYGHGYIIGGYDYEKIDGKRGTTNAVTKESNSFYAIGTYNITDVFSISLGDRFEFDDYDIFRTSSYDTVNQTTDETNNAFEFVLNAKYDEDGNAYIKYERGFIAPSPYNRTDKILVNGEGKYRLNDIQSEVYDTFEIGVKDIIFGQFASISAYYTKSNDEIQIVWDSVGHAMAWHWDNLDETERYGIEAFFEEYLADNLSISQSINIIKAKITKGDNEGKKITYVPNFKGTFGVKYQPIDDLEIFGNYTYYGNAVDNSYVKIPYHATVDVSAKYTFIKNFGVQLGVRNLFNEEYNNYQSTSGGVTTYDPANERTFFAELSYNY